MEKEQKHDLSDQELENITAADNDELTARCNGADSKLICMSLNGCDWLSKCKRCCVPKPD